MTRKTTKDLEQERLIKTLILFGTLGAAIGLAVGFIWANSDNVKRLASGSGRGAGIRKPIKPNEVLKLGVSLITVARQISDLINKV